METCVINLDLETKSFTDLKKVGAWKYSEHETSDIICLAYKYFDDDKINVWLPGDPVPDIFKYKHIKYVARYALFEYAMCINVLLPKYKFPARMKKPDNWICTRALSVCAGMPGSLERSAKALNLPEKKDLHGNYLINTYSKPHKDKAGNLYFKEFTKEHKKLMVDYCVQDVKTDALAYKVLAPLSNAKLERDIFLLDMKQNIEGLPVDTKSLDTVLTYLEIKQKEAETKMEKIGVNVRSGPQMIDFINYRNSHYLTIDNVQKKTMEKVKAKLMDVGYLGFIHPRDKEILELIDLRAFLSKASVKKFNALHDRVSDDKKIRYTINYYGAHTGRFSGAGFQPHNLPKMGTSEKEINQIIKNFANIIEYPEIIESAKKILPGMVKAEPGKTFIMGDFSAIEARGIAYLAGEEKLLKQFRNNEPVYENMAALLYNIPVKKVSKKQRQLGKQTILACGYGLGVKTFKTTCDNYNIEVSDQLANKSVMTYRNTYPKIKKFWYDLQDAFLLAYQNRKKILKVGKHITVTGENNYIKIKLPSGRFLYYHRVKLEHNGDISYWNYQQNRRVNLWGGLLAENVTQAMCRDILTDRMLELDKRGLNPLLHVHDEIVCYVDKLNSKTLLKKFDEIMNTPPEWLPDFPLLTESEISGRYHK